MSAALPFDELFKAVESNSLAAVHALILKFPDDLEGKENVYNLLNLAHPQRKLSILQLAVGRYPKTSLKLIEILLEYGAGSELPSNYNEIENKSILVTPLWIAIKQKLPLEVIRLLLKYKADIFYRFSNGGGFSLLHLATKVESDEEILKILIENSSGLLINDQSNHLKQTPLSKTKHFSILLLILCLSVTLVIAVEQNCDHLTKLLLESKTNLELKDSNGLTAYEIAAKQKLIKICLLFPEEVLESYNYVLEVISKIEENTWQTRTGQVIQDLNELLPIEGYWEWTDESWSNFNSNLFYRLRKRIEITDQFYLEQSIDLVRQASTQKALNILLEGLQHESDPQKKSRAANYFQRLLQTAERDGANALGLLDNLSKSNLVILGDEAVKSSSTINNVTGTVYNTAAGTARLPPVTREFPNYKPPAFDSESDHDSDDSLLYCPVCSHRLASVPSERSSHLQSCLNSPRHKLLGDRYTNLSAAGSGSYGECPICYEEMGEGVVVMNCLCRFHGKCIEEWFERNKYKQCPYHSE